MAPYNYDKFSSQEYDLSNFGGPKLGAKAPDGMVTTLDGVSRQLLAFDKDFLVVELGSTTCPLFQSRRDAMAGLVHQHPNASFVILYVREAHPGAKIRQHSTMEDKIGCARLIEDAEQEGREVRVDDIKGSAHKAYGGYPNAVFIINKNGCVLFRSDWNDPSATGKAFDLLEAGKPANVRSFFKPARPPIALETLRRNGKGAAPDFFKSLPSLIWQNLIRRNLRVLMGAEPIVQPDAQC